MPVTDTSGDSSDSSQEVSIDAEEDGFFFKTSLLDSSDSFPSIDKEEPLVNLDFDDSIQIDKTPLLNLEDGSVDYSTVKNSELLDSKSGETVAARRSTVLRLDARQAAASKIWRKYRRNTE